MLKKLFRFLLSRHVQSSVLFFSLFLVIGSFQSQPRRTIPCPYLVGAVSRDGKLFATVDGEHAVEILTTETMSQVRRLEQTAVNALFPDQFSKDNKFLAVIVGTVPASGIATFPLYVWNIEKREEPLVFQDASFRFAFSPDSRLLAVADRPRSYSSDSKVSETVGIWDLTKRKRLREIAVEGGIHILDWSPDGSKIVTISSTNHKVQVWNAANGSEIKSLVRSEQEEQFNLCSFSSDGRTIIGWTEWGDFISWDPDTDAIVVQTLLPSLSQEIYRYSPLHDYMARHYVPEWIDSDEKYKWIPEWVKSSASSIFGRIEVFEYQPTSRQIRMIMELPDLYRPRAILPGGQGLLTFRLGNTAKDGQLAWWSLEPKSPWLTALWWASGIAIAYWLICYWAISKWRSRSAA
jgi:dipeptidyl aminopeptidase/acylaminoacyl peptidase